MPSAVARTRVLFVLAVGAVAVGIVVGLRGLGFPPVLDERHFWPTSLFIAGPWFPSAELLRQSPDLNTPLPFWLFGTVAKVTGGGIVAARAFNLALSVSLLLAIGWPTEDQPTAWKRALGLALFPYFLGTGTLVYTDGIAAVFAFAGVAAHLRGRWWLGALCSALAIASRQYMVAFPLALALWELLPDRRALPHRASRTVAPLVAAATLAGWFLLYGGAAPPRALALQPVPTASRWLQLFPDHPLYLLACLGAYFVPLESLLLHGRDWRTWPTRLGALRRDRRAWLLAAGLAILFIAFPPLGNTGRRIEAMGFLDRGLRTVFPDALRVAALYLLALLAALRVFRRGALPLPALLVLAYAAVLLKSHQAWDKYALPLLVLLWSTDVHPDPEAPTASGSGNNRNNRNNRTTTATPPTSTP